MAALFRCCLVSRVSWPFNCCYCQTPQAGSHSTDTAACIWEEKPAEHADNCCTKFSHSLSNQGFTEQRLKSPQGSENSQAREGNIFHCCYTFVNISFHKKSIRPKLFLPNPQRNNGPGAAAYPEIFFIAPPRYKPNTFPLPSYLF